MRNAFRGDFSPQDEKGEELTTRNEKSQQRGNVETVGQSLETLQVMKATFLPLVTLRRFAELFQSEEDYLRIMGDLCTIREHLANLFQYEGTPLQGNKEHPVFKIASSINEIIGELLSAGEYSLKTTPTPYGNTITLYRKNRLSLQPECK